MLGAYPASKTRSLPSIRANSTDMFNTVSTNMFVLFYSRTTPLTSLTGLHYPWLFQTLEMMHLKLYLLNYLYQPDHGLSN